MLRRAALKGEVPTDRVGGVADSRQWAAVVQNEAAVLQSHSPAVRPAGRCLLQAGRDVAFTPDDRNYFAGKVPAVARAEGRPKG